MRSFLSEIADQPRRPWRLVNVRTGGVIASSVETAFDSHSRRRGLLGRDAMADGTALIIAPCSSIHMFFMKFPIDVIFVDREGRVVKTRHDLQPWRIAGAWGAFATIELPTGIVASSGTRQGDYLNAVSAA